VKEIDVRGLACPAPVLQTKAALESGNINTVKIVVDNAAAKQNVSRFLESKGFQTAVERTGKDYIVFGTCDEKALPKSNTVDKTETGLKKIMIMVVTDRMGFGDDALGQKLMVNFIKTLKEMGPELWRLVFVNNGVKLTVAGSEVLTDLKEYEISGLHILVCGTCLNHFNLLEHKLVGETTNMLDIVTAMQLADQVINI